MISMSLGRRSPARYCDNFRSAAWLCPVDGRGGAILSVAATLGRLRTLRVMSDAQSFLRIYQPALTLEKVHSDRSPSLVHGTATRGIAQHETCSAAAPPGIRAISHDMPGCAAESLWHHDLGIFRRCRSGKAVSPVSPHWRKGCGTPRRCEHHHHVRNRFHPSDAPGLRQIPAHMRMLSGCSRVQ